MNNISFCSGVCCNIKNRCARFIMGKKARPNRIYWWVEPMCKDGRCSNFMKKKEGRK